METTEIRKLTNEQITSELAAQRRKIFDLRAQRVLESLAKDGYNPIIAHSFNYGDDVKAVAKKYPKTRFLLKYYECGMAFQGRVVYSGGEEVESSQGTYSGNRGG